MRTQITALLVLGACGLSACGGDDGDDPQQSADEKQVRAVLKQSLTTKDPKACSRLFTQAYLEQISAQRGDEARSGCRDEIDTDASKDVTVKDVKIIDATAIAEITPKGGLGFKTATIGLRKVDGRWRTGRYRSATLDRDAFNTYFRRSLRSQFDSPSASIVDCTLSDLASLDDKAIVDALIGTDRRAVVVPLLICALRVALAKQGAPPRATACVARRFRREATSGALGRKLDRANGSLAPLTGSEGRRLGRRFALSCVRG